LKRAHKWISALLALSLLVGFGAGLLARPVLFPKRRPRRPQRPSFPDYLAKRLSLSPEQKERLKAILSETRKQSAELRKQHRTQIRESLTPEQRTEFDKMTKEWEERRKRHRRPQGPRRRPGPRGRNGHPWPGRTHPADASKKPEPE